MPYFCYILECADGSYYTGWTTDPSRRLKQHNHGTGARYTRMHRPVRLVYWEEVANRSAALKREHQLKQLPRNRKEKVIFTGTPHVLRVVPDAAWLIRAPGRVNLLGEHVDYNGGVVLPAAIDRSVLAAAAPTPQDYHEIHALDLQESVYFSNTSLLLKQDIYGGLLPAWASYPAGVAWSALQHNLPVLPLKIAFDATVPSGAGLSSSAAIEVAFALAWKNAGNWKMDGMSLAKLCLQAEQEYVGLNCGLMDQFTCLHGQADHALLFDTLTLDWKTISLPADTAIVVIDSGIRHELTHSGYNERRRECDDALRILQSLLSPAPAYLAGVTLPELQSVADKISHVLYKRARHVVEECERVRLAAIALQQNDMLAFGQIMLVGHQSLSELYGVSLPELDALVEYAMNCTGCLGARLTGGGFGGSTVNLVERNKVDAFILAVTSAYYEGPGKRAACFPCRAADGAKVINLR